MYNYINLTDNDKPKDKILVAPYILKNYQRSQAKTRTSDMPQAKIKIGEIILALLRNK